MTRNILTSHNDIMSQPTRREFMLQSIATACAAYSVLTNVSHAEDQFTNWGWPQPYNTVSPSSVDWLKSKGWWPLKIGWNPLWSDGNIILYVMREQRLLEKRGIEVDYSNFSQASLMNEAFIPGGVQVVQAGSLGLLTAVGLNVPTIALATFPAQRQAFLVRPDSKLASLKDLKNQTVLGRPAVIGVSLGSSQHLGLLLAASVLGLTEGTDYVTINGIAPDLITMPDGIDIVVMFEPNVMLMEEFIKNARAIDLTDNYAIFNGYSYMRKEIEDSAPDIVQSYVDAFIEAELYLKANIDETVSKFVGDESQRGREPELIKKDIYTHVLSSKPTRHFPFVDTDGLWIPLEVFQANVMADAGVLQSRITEQQLKDVFRPEYMRNTFETLGWRKPDRPSFLPSAWEGRIGHPPYPPYGHAQMGEQNFPESNDLIKQWIFNGKTYNPQ